MITARPPHDGHMIAARPSHDCRPLPPIAAIGLLPTAHRPWEGAMASELWAVVQRLWSTATIGDRAMVGYRQKVVYLNTIITNPKGT